MLQNHYLKPFLDIPKSTIIEYMNFKSLPWREDSSNQVTKYKRNKARIDLIPVLCEMAGGRSALHRYYSYYFYEIP
jgi:tRNA(Ile)-lysidine synthase TilS/MesJ